MHCTGGVREIATHGSIQGTRAWFMHPQAEVTLKWCLLRTGLGCRVFLAFKI